MTTAQRRADGPAPGDLYLDPAVPDLERVTLTRDGWTAQASHVWTGTGWHRLVPGVVREVPTVQPLPTRAAIVLPPTGTAAIVSAEQSAAVAMIPGQRAGAGDGSASEPDAQAV